MSRSAGVNMVAQLVCATTRQTSLWTATGSPSSSSNSGRTHSIRRPAPPRPRRPPPRSSTPSGRIKQDGSSNPCSSNGSSNLYRCHRPSRGQAPTQRSPKSIVSALLATIPTIVIAFSLPRQRGDFCSCSSANKSWFGLLKLRRSDVALRPPTPTRTPTTPTQNQYQTKQKKQHK